MIQTPEHRHSDRRRTLELVWRESRFWKGAVDVKPEVGMSAVVILALLSAVVSLAEDRRPGHSRLRIMTINGEFPWDGVAPEEGNVDFPWKGSQTEAEEHMAAVAELITRNDPDVANVVEIENADALNRLAACFS
jgi:hypothetical protein